MFSSLTELSSYLVYLAPPLVGALIGYVTNRVAIRMLFRPLKAYHLGQLRIPMTPGVIPSKRHQLAANIGEMVGDHLLTGDEISRSLQKDDFQDHLSVLIETILSSTMKKDLGSLQTIVPPAYRSYFDIGVKTASYRLKEGLHTYLRSAEVRPTIESAVQNWVGMFLARRVDDFLPDQEKEFLAAKLAGSITEMLRGPEAETRLSALISSQIRKHAAAGTTCGDLLPEQVKNTIIEAVRAQTPRLLSQAARLLDDPEIKDRIVVAVIEAIEEFVETLGPMSSMVKGFLSRELLDEKIRAYLSDRQHEIQSFFQDQYLEIRIRAVLGERIGSVFETPLSDLLNEEDDGQLEPVSRFLAAGIMGLINGDETSRVLVELIKDYSARLTKKGEANIGDMAEQVLGPELFSRYRTRIEEELTAAIYSKELARFIDQLVEEMGERLVTRPIGRLDRLIPPGVIDGLVTSLREMTTRLLISEVPGVVKTINIKRIITERIDSFDLLRLEQLLLSIMAEQFKYINLFGALLGFIIGCANLLFVLGSH